MVKYFLRYLITMAKHAVNIEPSKYLGKYLPICLILPCAPAPIAQLVECPLRGTGGHWFDPGPRHTKVVIKLQAMQDAPPLQLYPASD